MAVLSRNSLCYAKASADIYCLSSESRWSLPLKDFRSSMESTSSSLESDFGRTRSPLAIKKVLVLTRSLSSKLRASVHVRASSLVAAETATKTATKGAFKTWRTSLTALLRANPVGNGYIKKKENSMDQVMSDRTPSL